MNVIIKIIISVQVILITGLVLLLTGVVDSSILDQQPVTKFNKTTVGVNVSGDYSPNQTSDIQSAGKEINTLAGSTPNLNNNNDSLNTAKGGSFNGLQVEVKNTPKFGDGTIDEFEEEPKLQELTGFKNNNPGRKSYQTPFTPREIYDIQVNDGLWGYFANPAERLERLKKIDPELSLINYRSEEFRNSILAEQLGLSPASKIYVLLELIKPIDLESIQALSGLGFGPVPILKQINYYKKYAGVFYVKYNKLKNIYRSSMVKNVYLLANYTATAKYELGIRSTESTDNLELKINYPYSKPGLKISNLEYRFEGENQFTEQDIKERSQLVVNTGIDAGKIYRFLSSHQVNINLLANINRNFVVAAKDMSIADYQRGIESYPEIKDIFTRQGEKIVPSEYVINIVRQINTKMDLSGIWKQITFFLDKDIEYDWQKRELFFSGNLPYYDIKDMYLNVEELSEKKVGACTERTSLEIAILRELGIASRSATRVYHIFTEVFVPEKGWASTSMILNEIPLCHSYDENMAYFIEWDKRFPVRLRWVAKIYPNILSNYLVDDSLAKN